MIPKKIHYCWFGNNPLPADALKCIASWKKFLPDYEIIEWNEKNFDINAIQYTAQAYEAKKYAFVSDYARFKILYEHGGLYFDTDVEVIKPMNDIIGRGAFMGIEKSLATSTGKGLIGVNAGLGLGAEAGLPIYKTILDFYDKRSFLNETGTVVTNVTQLLIREGLRNENKMQHVAGITIYPAEYFCPMDSTTGVVETSSETVSIHHYSCSWINHNSISYRLYVLKKRMIKIFGAKLIMRLTSAMNKMRNKNIE